MVLESKLTFFSSFFHHSPCSPFLWSLCASFTRLSQDSNNVFTAVGRKVGIFVLDGFDATQVSALSTGLTAMGCVVQLIGQRKGPA